MLPLKALKSLSVAVVALCCASVTFAQTTASIVGNVTDASGAVVGHCSVQVVETSTGQARTTTTDETGAYLFTLLPPGSYSIRVEAAGFKVAIRTNVAVSVQANVRVDIPLSVGNVSETVTVASQAPAVDTRQASIGETIDSERMVEMPLSGRSPTALLSLIPGVIVTDPGVSPTSYNVVVQVAGGQQSANNFIYDNTRYNSVQYGQGNPLPPPDFLDEMKVITNAYDAEKGLAAAATVQVVTKSGTNSFHGSLFEFHRDNALTARNYFAPKTPFLIQNQFGGTIGGPIIRNKTFFFFGYQGTAIHNSVLNNAAIPPTDAEKNGDFSQSVGGVPVDPATGQRFPNGRIPSSRFDPAAVKYLSIMAAANSAGGGYTSLSPSINNGKQFALKVDHNLTGNNQLSGRYWYSRGTSNTPNGNLPFGQTNYSLRFQNLNVWDIHTFTPNLLNMASFAWNRKFEAQTNANMPFNNPKDAGVNLPDTYTHPYPPAVNITGRVNLTPGTAGDPLRQDATEDFSDTLTWISGKSTWKLGGNYDRVRFGPDRASFDNGRFAFNGQVTGNAMADFMLGQPSSLLLYDEQENHRTYWVGFFAQNDYRVSKRITLNLGLRYHYEQPTEQVDGNSATFIPGFQSTRFPNAPAGMAFAGDPGIPKGIFNPQYRNFNPRFGIAWDVFGDGNTSLRLGYGIFTEVLINGYSQYLSLNQPFLESFTLTTVPSFSNPFGTGGLGFTVVPGNPAAQYNPETGQAQFLLPVTGWGADQYMPNPNLQQFSVSLQRQLIRDFSVEINYIGSAGRHLPLVYQANPAVYQPGATLANANQRRLFGGGKISGVTYFKDAGTSSYNALALSMKKRLSKSYLIDVSYTWARSIDIQSGQPYTASTIQDPFNFRGSRGLSDFQRKHVLAISGLWDLPTWHSGGFFGRNIIGGWRLSGIFGAQSGMPFNVVSGRDYSLTAVNSDRPNLVGNPVLSSGRSQEQMIAQYFNTSAFVANSAGQYGNFGRNALVGPGLVNLDSGLFKEIRGWEDTRFQFRAEFFNTFNHANFSNPVPTLVSPAFGRIQSAGTARQIQFAMKFLF
ncbi:TonB-dependent receptor [Edaphobacter albus]|uniref:TonB-dependent receptor n=1 Tax=Edaphobacter sp. 4G125 TaxID=2763071 RepID=UPI001647C3ED|nr:TonB-dependent receptor [Edaphobacter sp. 4G125]QNI37669.1 TonB-dependent receptor [Edaphobacter sp. 4G125]